MEDFHETNRATHEDIFIATLRATMNLLPGAAFFEQYWATFLQSPLQVRLNNWFQELYERVKYLEENRGIDVGTLQSDPNFIDAVLKITPIAQATSQREKLQAFKNALTNIALRSSPGQTKIHLFLRLIDNLSVDHIRVLKFIHDPGGWYLQHGITMPYLGGHGRTLLYLMNAGQCTVGEVAVANMIFSDLYNYSLTVSKINVNLENYISQVEVSRSRTSSIGSEFLRFISFEEGKNL